MEIAERAGVLPANAGNVRPAGTTPRIVLFNVEREAEAEQHCQSLIQNHADRAVGYAILSSWLLHGSRTGSPDSARCARAIELLEQALAYPVSDAEDYDLAARLIAARESLSKAKLH